MAPASVLPPTRLGSVRKAWCVFLVTPCSQTPQVHANAQVVGPNIIHYHSDPSCVGNECQAASDCYSGPVVGAGGEVRGDRQPQMSPLTKHTQVVSVAGKCHNLADASCTCQQGVCVIEGHLFPFPGQ